MPITKETKIVSNTVSKFESEIDRISKFDPKTKLRKKVQVESVMDTMLNRKEMSGKDYGIIKRYIDEKIPEPSGPLEYIRECNRESIKRNMTRNSPSVEEILKNRIED